MGPPTAIHESNVVSRNSARQSPGNDEARRAINLVKVYFKKNLWLTDEESKSLDRMMNCLGDYHGKFPREAKWEYTNSGDSFTT